MHCSRCEADNPEGMKFCIEGAAPLTRRCPQCGVANPPQAKFCEQCATSLTGQTPTPHPASASQQPLSYTPGHLVEKILTARAALEGERKQVTVLFADLKGSMELLADRDPEEARQLLERVLERVMAAVHRYEGTVNQVMGIGASWPCSGHRSRTRTIKPSPTACKVRRLLRYEHQLNVSLSSRWRETPGLIKCQEQARMIEYNLNFPREALRYSNAASRAQVYTYLT
jgi:hypothetical protein